MKLEVVFEQFIKDLKRFDPNIANSAIANRHYSEKDVITIVKENFLEPSPSKTEILAGNVNKEFLTSIEYLKIGDLYRKSAESRKKVIEKHIIQLCKCYSELVPDEKKDLLESAMANPMQFIQQNMYMLPLLANMIITDEAKDLFNDIVEKYKSPTVEEVPAKMKEFVNNEEDFMRVFNFILNTLNMLKDKIKI